MIQKYLFLSLFIFIILFDFNSAFATSNEVIKGTVGGDTLNIFLKYWKTGIFFLTFLYIVGMFILGLRIIGSTGDQNKLNTTKGSMVNITVGYFSIFLLSGIITFSLGVFNNTSKEGLLTYDDSLRPAGTFNDVGLIGKKSVTEVKQLQEMIDSMDNQLAVQNAFGGGNSISGDSQQELLDATLAMKKVSNILLDEKFEKPDNGNLLIAMAGANNGFSKNDTNALNVKINEMKSEGKITDQELKLVQLVLSRNVKTE